MSHCNRPKRLVLSGALYQVYLIVLQKPMGILSLLDEESSFPQSNDYSLAGELMGLLLASERDTYRGNTIENRGCLFVYMFGRT